MLRKGEGCLIDCRRKYYYQTSSYHWISTSLYFNGLPADPLVQSYLQSGNVKFSDAEFLNFEPLQTHILQCTQKVSFMQENYMKDLSIEEISRQMGFSDSVYFIQVFKKTEGITPSKFRKMR